MFLIKLLNIRIVLLLAVMLLIIVFVMVKNQDSLDLISSDTSSIAVPDFPVYPESTIFRMATKPPSDFAVAFASNDSPQEVFDFLLKNAKENGWQVIDQKGLIFESTKQETTVTISVSRNPGEQTAILQQVKFDQERKTIE